MDVNFLFLINESPDRESEKNNYKIISNKKKLRLLKDADQYMYILLFCAFMHLYVRTKSSKIRFPFV